LGIVILMPLVIIIFFFHIVITKSYAWGALNLVWLIVLGWHFPHSVPFTLELCGIRGRGGSGKRSVTPRRKHTAFLINRLAGNIFSCRGGISQSAGIHLQSLFQPRPEKR
jgi:hypothetical protein